MIVNILIILLILTFIGYSFVYAFFPNKGNVFVENRDTDGPIDMPILSEIMKYILKKIQEIENGIYTLNIESLMIRIEIE